MLSILYERRDDAPSPSMWLAVLECIMGTVSVVFGLVAFVSGCSCVVDDSYSNDFNGVDGVSRFPVPWPLLCVAVLHILLGVYMSWRALLVGRWKLRYLVLYEACSFPTVADTVAPGVEATAAASSEYVGPLGTSLMPGPESLQASSQQFPRQQYGGASRSTIVRLFKRYFLVKAMHIAFDVAIVLVFLIANPQCSDSCAPPVTPQPVTPQPWTPYPTPSPTPEPPTPAPTPVPPNRLQLTQMYCPSSSSCGPPCEPSYLMNLQCFETTGGGSAMFVLLNSTIAVEMNFAVTGCRSFSYNFTTVAGDCYNLTGASLYLTWEWPYAREAAATAEPYHDATQPSREMKLPLQHSAMRDARCSPETCWGSCCAGVCIEGKCPRWAAAKQPTNWVIGLLILIAALLAGIAFGIISRVDSASNTTAGQVASVTKSLKRDLTGGQNRVAMLKLFFSSIGSQFTLIGPEITFLQSIIVAPGSVVFIVAAVNFMFACIRVTVEFLLSLYIIYGFTFIQGRPFREQVLSLCKSGTGATVVQLYTALYRPVVPDAPVKGALGWAVVFADTVQLSFAAFIISTAFDTATYGTVFEPMNNGFENFCSQAPNLLVMIFKAFSIVTTLRRLVGGCSAAPVTTDKLDNFLHLRWVQDRQYHQKAFPSDSDVAALLRFGFYFSAYEMERTGLLSKRGATSLCSLLVYMGVTLSFVLGMTTASLLVALAFFGLQVVAGYFLRHRCIRVDLTDRSVYITTVWRTVPFVQSSVEVDLSRVSLELSAEQDVFVLSLTTWSSPEVEDQRPFRYVVTEVGTIDAEKLAQQHRQHMLDLVTLLREDAKRSAGSAEDDQPPTCDALDEPQGSSAFVAAAGRSGSRRRLVESEQDKGACVLTASNVVNIESNQVLSAEDSSKITMPVDYKNDVVVFLKFTQEVPVDANGVPSDATHGGTFDTPLCWCFSDAEVCVEGTVFGICQSYRQETVLTMGLQDTDPHPCGWCCHCVGMPCCCPCCHQHTVRKSLQRKVFGEQPSEQSHFCKEFCSIICCYCCKVMQTHQELTSRHYRVGGMVLGRRTAAGSILMDGDARPQRSVLLVATRWLRLVVTLLISFFTFHAPYGEWLFQACWDGRKQFSVQLFNVHEVHHLVEYCRSSTAVLVAVHVLAVTMMIASLASSLAAAFPVYRPRAMLNAKAVGVISAVVVMFCTFFFFFFLLVEAFGNTCGCVANEKVFIESAVVMLLSLLAIPLQIATPITFHESDKPLNDDAASQQPSLRTRLLPPTPKSIV